jgi:amidase
MARSVRDLQLLLGVLADVPTLPPPALSDIRIGLWLDEPTFPLDPAVRAAIADFAGRLAREGVAVDPIASPLPAQAMLWTYMTLLAAILGAAQPAAALAVFELFRGPAKIAKALGAGPLSWAHGVIGCTARYHEWFAANEARAQMKAQLAPVFDRCDVILAPVAGVTAFPHDHGPLQVMRRLTMSDGRRIGYLELVDWIALATLCDLPVTVIPIGRTPDGLPIGVQIIGRPGADAATLAVAGALEGVAGGFRAPPPLGAAAGQTSRRQKTPKRKAAETGAKVT